MKKIYLTVLLLSLLKLTATAQVGIEIGLNMADLAVKSNNNSVPTTFKPGVNFGFIGALALGDHGFFEPGVFFQMTGCKFTGTPTSKENINTISIPLNFEYKSGERCGSRFFFGGGPFIGYNVSGNYSTDVTGAATVDLKIGSDKTKDNIKALDAGIGVNVGYQLKSRLYARLRYQVGLTELLPATDGGSSVKSSSFGISLGFLFGHCNSFSLAPGFKTQHGNHWRGLSKGKYSRKARYMRS